MRADEGYELDRSLPLLLRVIRCLPNTERASGSDGRRLISLKGGNRGQEGARLCDVLDLWGFESRKW